METTIAGITFPNPFFNASGVCCTTKEELEILRDTGAGGIWTKTTTLEPREGNPFPRVFHLSSRPSKGEENGVCVSGNCVGLANNGCAQMNQTIKELKSRTITDLRGGSRTITDLRGGSRTITDLRGGSTQPVVLSVGGPDLFNIVQMIELSKDNDSIAAIEINPSCPNLEGDMLAFNFDSLKLLLQYVKLTGIQKPIGLKLPYYQNPGHFKQIATIIDETKPLIKFVTCINGMPGLYFDPETNDTRTRANGGITGMGGDLLLPFALGNIARFYKLFKEMNLNVDIIGCGGATCAEAAWQMIWAGAKGVQVGTRLLVEMNLPENKVRHGLSMFWNQMVLGLYSAMEKYGNFKNIEDACGGYHTMDHVISDENVLVTSTTTVVNVESETLISNNYANTLVLKDEK